MKAGRQLSTAALLATLAAGALGGCGIADPYQARHTSSPAATATSSTTATGPIPAPERGGSIPPAARAAQDRVAASAARRTPQATLERYARLYVNWTAHTVAAIQRELASLSVGQARALALQAAASYARDQTLEQSGVANSGHVVAIAQSLTTFGQWVLVTSEQTTGRGAYSGLPNTLHVIYAEVTRTGSGWVVSEWAPQN